MMYVKVHRSYRNVVAICDSILLGKKFEEGKRQFEVRENFFKGNEHTFNEVTKIMEIESIEDSTFNIIGHESIKAAKEANLIKEDSISEIQGVPFALVLG